MHTYCVHLVFVDSFRTAYVRAHSAVEAKRIAERRQVYPFLAYEARKVA